MAVVAVWGVVKGVTDVEVAPEVRKTLLVLPTLLTVLGQPLVSLNEAFVNNSPPLSIVELQLLVNCLKVYSKVPV